MESKSLEIAEEGCNLHSQTVSQGQVGLLKLLGMESSMPA